MKVKGKTVWVVGASAGIGEYVAYECARRGASTLILSARRTDQLERVKRQCESLGAATYVEMLDVTDSAQIESVTTDITSQHSVDILVNNAGVSQRAKAGETPLEVERRMFEINYFGLLDITKRVLPGMLERGNGHIAITSSVVGKFGFPLRSTYSATKHALHGYFDSLYLEYEDQGIGTTLVCPGRIKTDVSRNALTAAGTPSGEMDEGQLKGMSVEKCARKFVNGIERNVREVYIGKESIIIYLRRFIPALYYWMAGRVKAR